MKKTIGGLKIQLANYLQEKIDNHQETAITCKCSHCGETHSGNLLKKVKSVKTGFEACGQQPDIAFLTETKRSLPQPILSKEKRLTNVAICYFTQKLKQIL